MRVRTRIFAITVIAAMALADVAAARCIISDHTVLINNGLEYPGGVPNYRQADFPGDNDCGPTAAAMLLGYWDRHGWPTIVPNASPYYVDGLATLGIDDLVRQLQLEMPYDPTFGTWDLAAVLPFIPGDIESYVTAVAGIQDWGAGGWYGDDDDTVSLDQVQGHLDAGRPVLMLVKWPGITVTQSDGAADRSVKTHWMTIFGYRRIRDGLTIPWLGCVDWLNEDEFYFHMRSGYKNGGNHYYTYNWTGLISLDDIYTVEIQPTGGTASPRQNRGVYVSLSNPTSQMSTCAGTCGDQAPGGCWCDSVCSSYGDCCADYQPACNRVQGSSQTTQFAVRSTRHSDRLLAGDFNGDGRDDVVKIEIDPANYGLSLEVGISNGSGFTFSDWGGNGGSEESKIVVGDFDGNGKDDVMVFLVPHEDNVANGVLLFSSNGSYFSTSFWGTTQQIDANTQVFTGHFDSDGDLDVALVVPWGETSAYLVVGENTGSELRWHHTTVLSSADGYNAWTRFAAGDFDDDGLTDLVMVPVNVPDPDIVDIAVAHVAGIFEDYFGVTILGNDPALIVDISVFRSTGTHSFLRSTWGQVHTTRDAKVLVGDFDNDGDDDLAHLQAPGPGNPTALPVQVGLSTGSAFSIASWATWTTSTEMHAFTGDFNGDERDDIATFQVPRVGAAAGSLRVGLSSGSGLTTNTYATWTTDKFVRFTLGDFNGDFKVDVAGMDCAN